MRVVVPAYERMTKYLGMAAERVSEDHRLVGQLASRVNALECARSGSLVFVGHGVSNWFRTAPDLGKHLEESASTASHSILLDSDDRFCKGSVVVGLCCNAAVGLGVAVAGEGGIYIGFSCKIPFFVEEEDSEPLECYARLIIGLCDMIISLRPEELACTDSIGEKVGSVYKTVIDSLERGGDLNAYRFSGVLNLVLTAQKENIEVIVLRDN